MAPGSPAGEKKIAPGAYTDFAFEMHDGLAFQMILIYHQGIICGVAFARSSLRRIASYASVVAPRRLASDALLVIRNRSKPTGTINGFRIRRWIWAL